MARSFLGRALFEELPLKLVAMVLAVTLFVIVRSDRDAATGAFVKVVYSLPEDRVLGTDPPSEVKVGIRGSWTRLQRFDEREIEPLRVDLSSKPTTLRFDADAVKLPVGVHVASIFPSEIKLEYEPRAVKDIPVQPLFEGAPQEGFRVVKVTVVPPTVRVDGAERVVEAMKRAATRPLRLQDATGPVHGTVMLEPAPKQTRFVDVTSVAVDVDIRPAIVERSLDAVQVKITGAQRLEGTIDPGAVKVILRGPSDVVRRVDLEAVLVSVDGRLEDGRPPSSYRKRLVVSGLPSGVAAELRPDTVLLSTHRHHE